MRNNNNGTIRVFTLDPIFVAEKFGRATKKEQGEGGQSERGVTDSEGGGI